MLENKTLPTGFKLGHMRVTVNFTTQELMTGIDRFVQIPRDVTLCTITGRHRTGEVFSAVGMTIQNPTDKPSAAVAEKNAFFDAAYTLWAKDCGLVDPDTYASTLWSAYQKTVHGIKVPKVPAGLLLEAFF